MFPSCRQFSSMAGIHISSYHPILHQCSINNKICSAAITTACFTSLVLCQLMKNQKIRIVAIFRSLHLARIFFLGSMVNFLEEFGAQVPIGLEHCPNEEILELLHNFREIMSLKRRKPGELTSLRLVSYNDKVK